MAFEPAWRHVVAARFSTTGAQKGEPNSAPSHRQARGFCLLPTATRVFARRQRLTTSRDFGNVFSGAERSSDRFFTVLVTTGRSASARLGLAVSKRAAKRAVDRNRLKRLARESFRHSELAALDFVVMAKQGAALTDSRTLRQSLDRHFERLNRRASAKGDG
jgi:ribonuclease P protein component